MCVCKKPAAPISAPVNVYVSLLSVSISTALIFFAPNSINMKYSRQEEDARLVLSLSCAPIAMNAAPRRRKRAAADGVFECKTCRKQFRSFQALGGHCTSHKRPTSSAGGERARGWKLRPALHKCGVCGREFSLGQALGGHMRRHGKSTSATSLSGDLSSELDGSRSSDNSDAAVDRSEQNGSHGVLLELFV